MIITHEILVAKRGGRGSLINFIMLYIQLNRPGWSGHSLSMARTTMKRKSFGIAVKMKVGPKFAEFKPCSSLDGILLEFYKCSLSFNLMKL